MYRETSQRAEERNVGFFSSSLWWGGIEKKNVVVASAQTLLMELVLLPTPTSQDNCSPSLSILSAAF